MKEFNADMVCEKCRVPYIATGVDTENIYYSCSCEFWLDDPKENENSDCISANEGHQQNLEKEAAIEFANLKIKYSASFYQDRDPISPLYKILLQLENATMISDSDI